MQKLKQLSESNIKYLCGFIRSCQSAKDGISDSSLPETTSTYSSIKITQLIQNALNDANSYAENLISNLNKLETKVVADISEVKDYNILYLVKVQPTDTFYTQYLVVKDDTGSDVRVEIGNTSLSLDSYYDKTTSDARFASKTDVNSISNTIGSESLVTTSQTLKGAINECAGALATKTELDKKIDKSSIATTIGNTSTDEQVASAKAVYTATKYASGYAEKSVDDCDNCITTGYYVASSSCINVPSGESYGILKVYGRRTDIESLNSQWIVQEYTSTSGKRYIRSSINPNSLTPTNWGSWKRLCHTTVADVALTSNGVSLINNSTAKGAVFYSVKNGYANVSINEINFTNGTSCEIAGIPIPAQYIYSNLGYGGSVVGEVYANANDSTIKVVIPTVGSTGYGFISYPVKES